MSSTVIVMTSPQRDPEDARPDEASRAPADPAARKQALIEQFRANRGYFDPIWDDIIELDLEFFEEYERFSSTPWKHGALEPKMKELIALALAASVTHLYEPGIRVHARQAIRFGATREELMEVFELVAILGVHSLTVGLPLLVDELAKAEGETGEATSEG